MSDPNSIFQNSFYIGNSFILILYGVELMLYFWTVWLIMNNRTHDQHGEKRLLYFSTGLLCMDTIFLAVQVVFGEEMWIVHADYPGGSGQYLSDNAAIWYETLGSVSSVVLSLMSDALLIYRTYVVWSNWHVVIIPSVLYLGTAALGILNCYTSGVPNANFFVGKAAQIALAYSSVVIGLNFTCSVLICARILWVAKSMEQTLGREVSKTYTGAASLVIESMLPYTLFGIAYIVTLGINHPTSIFFLSIYLMFTCLSPQMIIVRVLIGRAWTKDSAPAGTSLRFGTRIHNETDTDNAQDTYGTTSDRTAIKLNEISELSGSSPDVVVHSLAKIA